MEPVPYRFRERVFRKYEDIIATICNEWPGPSIFTPASTETFSCRLRDAIKSLRNNQWQTKIVPMAKFVQICDEIVVGVKGGDVICGEREMVRRAPEPISKVSELSRLEKVVIKYPEQIRALCILRDGIAPLLMNPIHCHLEEPTLMDQKFFDTLESEYDIRVSVKDPETIVII